MLYHAITKYNELLSKEYRWCIGHKGKEKIVELIFTKEMFSHLIGLQYLTDLKQLESNKDALYEKILKKQITQADLEKSQHFNQDIQNRINYTEYLEEILDGLGRTSQLFMRRNKDGSIHKYSKIVADYVISYHIDNKKILFFIKYNSTEKKHIGISLFSKKQLNYTDPQYVIEMTSLKLDKTYFKHPNYKP